MHNAYYHNCARASTYMRDFAVCVQEVVNESGRFLEKAITLVNYQGLDNKLKEISNSRVPFFEEREPIDECPEVQFNRFFNEVMKNIWISPAHYDKIILDKNQ